MSSRAPGRRAARNVRASAVLAIRREVSIPPPPDAAGTAGAALPPAARIGPVFPERLAAERSSVVVVRVVPRRDVPATLDAQISPDHDWQEYTSRPRSG